MTAPVVNIWTDGACINNPGLMGIGALVIDGDQRHELSEHIGMGTNNVAELTAIERGLALAFKMRGGNSGSFIVHTDSRYAIGVLSQGWKAKANAALVARIRKKLPHKIGFVWVRGHSGVPENERCDHLATSAALGKPPLAEGEYSTASIPSDAAVAKMKRNERLQQLARDILEDFSCGCNEDGRAQDCECGGDGTPYGGNEGCWKCQAFTTLNGHGTKPAEEAA